MVVQEGANHGLIEKYQVLQQAHDLATEQFGVAVNRGDLDEARKLHNKLEAALRDFSEELSPPECALTGDLTALQNAQKLRVLDVSINNGLNKGPLKL